MYLPPPVSTVILMKKKIRDITLVIYKNHGKVVCDSPFFSIMIEGMESAARTAGYRMQICTLTRSSPDYDTILRELLENHTSALLLLATELPEEEFQKFETCDLPLVLVDARFENTRHSTVLIENTDSAYQAVTLLWERGHRKIGYLKSQERIRNFLNREKGYLDALKPKQSRRIRFYRLSSPRKWMPLIRRCNAFSTTRIDFRPPILPTTT